VDFMTDAANCGACRQPCPSGQTCAGGQCACPRGEKLCGGSCVKIDDPNYGCSDSGCDRCALANVATATCDGTACAVKECARGFENCDGEPSNGCESNPQVDSRNCGVCRNACGAGQSCVEGNCKDVAVSCNPPEEDCGGVCKNTQTDAQNCGRCGLSCAAGLTCVAGACSCPAGQTSCAGQCVDLGSSATHCGACGAACAAGQTCSGGSCVCSGGQWLCGGTCVDVRTNSSHCGGCGLACPAGQTCSNAMCGCAAGQSYCGGACVSTTMNDLYCGPAGMGCGTACGGGQTCSSGMCGCPAGQQLCMGACVDTTTSNTHCAPAGSGCGVACTGGQTCVSGACTCPAGTRLCGGTCVDTLTNSSYCTSAPTGCGTACGPGAPVCLGGTCSSTPPDNDALAGARPINLANGWNQTFGMDTSTATMNGTVPAACACSTPVKDVYFKFTLAVRELVHINTFGTSWDTVVWLLDSMGNALPAPAAGSWLATCNDNASSLCSTLPATKQSALVADLQPGTYHIAIAGCGAASYGQLYAQFQHRVVGNTGSLSLQGEYNSGHGYTFSKATGPLTGTGATGDLCCSDGPDKTLWFVTCPGSSALSNVKITASTCYDAADTDTTLHMASLPPSSCAADGCGANGKKSLLQKTLTTGSGLHAVHSDLCGAGATASPDVLVTFDDCVAPYSMCSGKCVVLASDNDHCGGCGKKCGAGYSCQQSVCRPVNDLRANAIVVTPSSTEVTVTGTTFDAGHDGPTPTCGKSGCNNGNNVWYKFTLAQTSFVYVDTAGSFKGDVLFQGDTIVYLTDANGALLPGQATWGFPDAGLCNDDSGCTATSHGWTSSGKDARTAGYLQPGTYHVAVGTCGAFGTSFTAHFQFKVDDLNVTYATIPLRGTGTTVTDTLQDTNLVQIGGTCGGTGSASLMERAWPFYLCGGATGWLFSMCPSDGGTWVRKNGTYTFDPVMYVRSAMTNTQRYCNDDGGSVGASDCRGTGGDMLHLGSRVSPAGFASFPRGLNFVYVDSKTGYPGTMSYSLKFTVPQ
jgi:hypothetical protein